MTTVSDANDSQEEISTWFQTCTNYFGRVTISSYPLPLFICDEFELFYFVQLWSWLNLSQSALIITWDGLRGMEYLPNADNFLIYCIHHIILNYISRQKRVAEVDCVQEKYNSDET